MRLARRFGESELRIVNTYSSSSVSVH
jgi:hypothetical protein